MDQFKLRASMSRKGDCYDNAPMESFWGTLKNELVHHRRYETREQAIREITEYIEVFYNRQRRQARLGYLSPAVYERQFYARQVAARESLSCPLLTSGLKRLLLLCQKSMPVINVINYVLHRSIKCS
jgi:hypothetical protein